MDTTEVMTRTKWSIDPMQSEISFKVEHLLMTNMMGVFEEFDAGIYTTGEDFMAIEINLRINVASLNTGDPKRDEHLKSAAFFDVENHKQVTFSGNTLQNTSKYGSYDLYGELTIKGLTQQIKLEVEFEAAKKHVGEFEKAGFSAKGKINPEEWGLNMNNVLEAGDILLSNAVRINCEIELIKES